MGIFALSRAPVDPADVRDAAEQAIARLNIVIRR
jgi:hypothetical protein